MIIYLWKTTSDNYIKTEWLKNKRLSEKHYFLANECNTSIPTRTSSNKDVFFRYLINQVFPEITDLDSVKQYKQINNLKNLDIFCIQYKGGSRKINKI